MPGGKSVVQAVIKEVYNKESVSNTNSIPKAVATMGILCETTHTGQETCDHEAPGDIEVIKVVVCLGLVTVIAEEAAHLFNLALQEVAQRYRRHL